MGIRRGLFQPLQTASQFQPPAKGRVTTEFSMYRTAVACVVQMMTVKVQIQRRKEGDSPLEMAKVCKAGPARIAGKQAHRRGPGG
jgi:hypothetical protein